MKTYIAFSWVLSVLIMACTLPGRSAIIEIPADFASIQQGIDASVTGDTILVSPGTYFEENGVQITDKGVVLASLFLMTGDTSYISSTIISGISWNVGRTIFVHSFETVRIIGFTITNDQGGGIYCHGITEIMNNRVINNTVDPFFSNVSGIGIYAFGICMISDNEIAGNSLVILNGSDNHSISGAGIFGSGNITINRNNIHNNGCFIEDAFIALKGGGIYCAGNCLIDNNIIADNYMQANSAFGLEFDTRGAGIYLQDSGTIINNVIRGNHANADAIALGIGANATSYGGGIFCNSGALIQNNTIASNSCWASAMTDDGVASAGAAGGGVFGGTLINNLVMNNSCGAGATAWEWAYCGTSGGGVITSGQLINNTIINNSDGGCNPHGGGVDGGILTNNIVFNNTPDNVYSATASYCNIEGGYPGIGNINVDPFFVTGPSGDYYLSQISSGQTQQSQCVDAGDPASIVSIDGTTRTDSYPDEGITDIGYHFRFTYFHLQLKAFLEGPFNGTDMNTTLNPVLPLGHQFNPPLPYFGNPMPDWHYSGTESVEAIPNSSIVDWVVVQLREGTSPATATTILATQAAFINNTGNIVGLDGTNPLNFTTNYSLNLYAVVWHRNHLGIISANPLVNVGGTFTYDFSSGSGQAYGGTSAQKQLATGIWGMISGDGDGSGGILNNDRDLVWDMQTGTTGYKAGDYNMNRQVNNPDKNEKWLPNLGKGSFLP